ERAHAEILGGAQEGRCQGQVGQLTRRRVRSSRVVDSPRHRVAYPPIPCPEEMDMTARQLPPYAAAMAVAAVAVAALMPTARAQPRQRFLYAALPGVGGGNNLKYGGAGILVFDIDHGHRLVRRIPLQGPPPDDGRQEAIKGIAAHAGTARLYVSTSRRVAAYDLHTDRLVWERRYDD